jgi:hypothetical protein
MLRKLILSIFLIAGLCALGVHSVNAQQTVVGQDNPAVDVQAVQAAVSQGGEILLKKTFDFGEKGSVIINKDVKIVGEKAGQGVPATKIKGGTRTFFSPLPAQLPPPTPGPKIAIQNIHFDGTLAFPIHVAYCSGATITGNKITNVRPVVTPQVNLSVGVMVLSPLPIMISIWLMTPLQRPLAMVYLSPGLPALLCEFQKTQYKIAQEVQ